MKSGRRGWGEGKVGVGKRERVVDWQRSLAEELFYGLKKFGFNNRGWINFSKFFCCLQSAKMNQRHMRSARKWLKNLASRFAMSRSNSWDTNSRGAVQRLATIVSNAVEITRIFERFCYHSCPSLCLNSQTIVTSRAVAVKLFLHFHYLQLLVLLFAY